MKHFFYYLSGLMLIMLSPDAAFAQKIDDEKIEFRYVLMPVKNLSAHLSTYHVSCKDRQTVHGNTLRSPELTRYSLVGSYYRLDKPEDADMLVEIEVVDDLSVKSLTARVDTFIYEQPVKKERTEESKNSKTEGSKSEAAKTATTIKVLYPAWHYTIKYTVPIIHYRFYTRSDTTIRDQMIGGYEKTEYFGSVSYNDHYSSESALSAGWNQQKNGILAGYERTHYTELIGAVQRYFKEFGLRYDTNSFHVKYVARNKPEEYADLLQAADTLKAGLLLFNSDYMALINKIIRPDYERRKALLEKSIAIGEQALTESDVRNRRARIDADVTRAIYYNLAIAYLLLNDFPKTKEYVKRADTLDNSGNIFERARKARRRVDLNKFKEDMAFQEAHYKDNTWRPLLYTDDQPYVYKDPETRRREQEAAAAAQQPAGAKAKPAPPKKPAPSVKKPTAASKPKISSSHKN